MHPHTPFGPRFRNRPLRYPPLTARSGRRATRKHGLSQQNREQIEVGGGSVNYLGRNSEGYEYVLRRLFTAHHNGFGKHYGPHNNDMDISMVRKIEPKLPQRPRHQERLDVLIKIKTVHRMTNGEVEWLY